MNAYNKNQELGCGLKKALLTHEKERIRGERT